MQASSPARPSMYASHSLGSSASRRANPTAIENINLGKPIDLNSSTSSRDCLTGEAVTKRAFHIDVVLEGTRKDPLGEATQILLAQLGKPLSYSSFISQATASSSSTGQPRSAPGTPSKVAKAGKQNPIKLGKIIQELQETEQGYLRRISYLKSSYADPLRKFAKRKDTMIIPPYEANVMFANIDNLVISAEAFCRDLLHIDISGRVAGQGIGDVCLRHVSGALTKRLAPKQLTCLNRTKLKDLGTFDCYKAYYDRQDESQKVLQEMFRRSSFQTFTEVRSKIPNIWHWKLGYPRATRGACSTATKVPSSVARSLAMIDSMSVYDTQRPKLEECILIASKIAACEADERVKRATVMYCMERTVDAFPANLISNNRDYIDSIDVEDTFTEYHRRAGSMSHSTTSTRPSLPYDNLPLPIMSPGPNRSGTSSLPCTLILFDDKLVIVKRQSASVNGRTVTGLDNIDRLMRSGGGLAGLAQSKTTLNKDKLGFKGVIDILDVTATDVGNCEFELFFGKAPHDLGDKWSNRPFRHYQVVHPPLSVNLEYTPARTDKQRFVQNLWKAQALARTRLPASARRNTHITHSTALPIAFVSKNNRKLEGSDGLAGQAICFWNMWERAAWNAHPHKGKVVLHVDETGIAASIPLGPQGDPLVVIRATPIPTGDCRYVMMMKSTEAKLSVTPSEDEEDLLESNIIRVEDIDNAVSHIVNVFGIYRFRTSNSSLPGTPSHANRFRPSMMNLDNISKNLFGTGTMSSRYESSVSSKKSRSVVSRSSTLDTARFSLESKSTVATSVDCDLTGKTPSPRRTRRSASPQDADVRGRSGISPKRDVFSIYKEQGDIGLTESRMGGDASDIDLDVQLDIARKNSVSVATSAYPSSHSVSSSMGGKMMGYQGPASPQRGSLAVRNRTPSPSPDVTITALVLTTASALPLVRPLDLSRRKTPSPTRNLSAPTLLCNRDPRILDAPSQSERLSASMALERGRSVRSNGSLSKPMGPRSARRSGIRPADAAGSAYTSLVLPVGNGRVVTPSRETVPLKDHVDAITISPTLAHKRARSQEELAPRKRSADYTVSDIKTSTTASDSEHNRSILIDQRQDFAGSALRHVSSTTIGSTDTNDTVGKRYRGELSRGHGTLLSYHASENAAENTDEHVTVALRTSGNIRAELTELKVRLGRDVAAKDRLRRVDHRNPSLCRSPPSKRLSRRVAPEIAEREIVHGSISSRHSASSSKSDFDVSFLDDWTQGVAGLLDQLDHDLEQAKMGSTRLASLVLTLKSGLEKSASDLRRMTNQLETVSPKNGLANAQMADLKNELEAVYEAFNVELDGLFADATLPADEAFASLKRDLQSVTAQRNEMRLENIKLRRQLEEAKLQNKLATKI
ncbi:hypothetical protein QFC21_001277 [Naganishia friedmannii]|uniref:Uncharacterized protein n=1 Tax=Naganishia friedmannii TaxID=89922 RepID=A0ACC2W330_9TREE|nr:hypothetical protein QFC21_001277 [Naganishia friedmannii]